MQDELSWRIHVLTSITIPEREIHIKIKTEFDNSALSTKKAIICMKEKPVIY